MTSTPVLQEAPRKGDIAPDFSLQSTEGGEHVTLASFRGKESVLLAFFPLAFSGVCTVQMCDIGREFDEFVGAGVRVLPISVDSVYTLREFKSKHALPFEFLSDFKRDASRAYGVLMEERFYSNRAYFLVDRAGAVVWAQVEEHPGLKRDNKEVFEQIAAHT
ncbi:MAG: redoxin domain-containing protein [Gemmatimonadaceae bacterium]